MDLAKAMLKKLESPDLPKDYTVDDFYEEMGIPKEQRSDFVTAAILKQVIEKSDIKELPPINPVLLRNVEKGRSITRSIAGLLERFNKWHCPGYNSGQNPQRKEGR